MKKTLYYITITIGLVLALMIGLSNSHAGIIRKEWRINALEKIENFNIQDINTVKTTSIEELFKG